MFQRLPEIPVEHQHVLLPKKHGRAQLETIWKRCVFTTFPVANKARPGTVENPSKTLCFPVFPAAKKARNFTVENPLKTMCFLSFPIPGMAKKHENFGTLETNENPFKTQCLHIPALNGSPRPHPQSMRKALVLKTQMPIARKLRSCEFIGPGSTKLIPFHVICCVDMAIGM